MKSNYTKQKKQMSITSFFSTPKTKKIVKEQNETPESKNDSPSSIHSIENQNLNTLESPNTRKKEEFIIKNIQNLKLEQEKIYNSGKENVSKNSKKKLAEDNYTYDKNEESDSEDEMPIMYKKKVILLYVLYLFIRILTLMLKKLIVIILKKIFFLPFFLSFVFFIDLKNY